MQRKSKRMRRERCVKTNLSTLKRVRQYSVFDKDKHREREIKKIKNR